MFLAYQIMIIDDIVFDMQCQYAICFLKWQKGKIFIVAGVSDIGLIVLLTALLLALRDIVVLGGKYLIFVRKLCIYISQIC